MATNVIRNGSKKGLLVGLLSSCFILPAKLYMDDSYLKRCDTKVRGIQGDLVTFESTVLHPLSGGVANDLGNVSCHGTSYDVIDVGEDKVTGDVIHALSKTPSFKIGDAAEIALDWERRYALMKLHTAAHILSSIMYGKYGALVTGGHIEPDVAKDDFNIERADKQLFEGVIDEVNAVASKTIEVKVYYLPRDRALEIPGIIKLADRLPPESGELRIVEIVGRDIQADGGPHVRDTSEIGNVVLLRVENKGKNRKRVYYRIKD